MERLEVGCTLRFTHPVTGVCAIGAGDLAIYLGKSQARVITGQSTGWLVNLLLNAPVKRIGLEEMTREEGIKVIASLS